MRPALLLAALTLAAACGGGGAPAPSGPRTVEITISEFSFSPSVLTLQAGETVLLKLHNVGKLEHEFMAGRAATPSKGYAEDWLAKAAPALAPHTHGGEVHLGEGVRVSADWYSTLKLVVPQEPGRYEFGCFVAGHYEAGMKGTLIVR